MKQVKTKEGDRLDQIFFRYYENPAHFEAFLRANVKLTRNPTLRENLLVKLPDFDETAPAKTYTSPIFWD